MADVALSLPRNLLNQLLQRLNPLPPQVIFDCHFFVARETVSLLCRAALWVCFGDATAVRGCA